jgi:hydrophobe/amphiphile efflux-1 (HAE1) family protein
MVRIKDIGRAELGAQSYSLFGRNNGKPTTIILMYLQPGANALDTVNAAEATMDELAKSFPKGVHYSIPFNTTLFITESAHEVIKTLAEAVALVLLVVFIFLQSWRASLVPLLAVPVSIIGTFAGMLALGFTINTLTLFGLVLAIGIVVDDAIVVVENVERIMHEEGLAVREATIKAMQEVTGPVVAIVLVLSAVFVPVAFLGGLTGQLYKQFAVTIAISVAISGLVALTLSPALCRLLLKPQHGEGRGPFKYFNRAFTWITKVYVAITRLICRLWVLGLLAYILLCYAAWHFYQTVPSSFLPAEDQGVFIAAILLPDGASQARTNELAKKLEDYALAQPEVYNILTLGGLNLLAGGNNTNAATFFVVLNSWSQREGPEHSVDAVTGRIMKHFASAPEGMVLAFNLPPVRGLGLRAGFEMQLQARAGQDVRQLAAVSNDLLTKLRQNPAITAPSGTLSVALPQLFLELNRDKAKSIGIPITSVFDTLQAYFGALYVNDFNKYGRIYRVQLQAEPEFRSNPDDIKQVYVRSNKGEMVPLSEIISSHFQAGPNLVSRFNGFPSVQISGAPAPGISSGQAMDIVSKAVAGLPQGYGFEWSGISYQEIKAGNQAPMILGFGLLVVFLVLAAQYERWSLPVAVLLAVPLGVLGASLAVFIRGIDRDIYFQIGLLTLVGLSAKNAILIIEFCVVLREKGLPVMEAALEAARLRFRPIIMTSLAFILGVLPLVHSQGAGAAGRHSIGTGVMGGMIAATLLAIFFVPMFYVIIQRVTERRIHLEPHSPAPGTDAPAGHESHNPSADPGERE